jgi:hypothetical protein
VRSRVIRASCCAGVMAFFAVTSAAGAAPGSRTFQQTYPVASSLCARVAAGQGPRKLEAHAAAVAQACSQLMSAYAAAQGAVTTAYSNFVQARQAAISTRDGACTNAHIAHSRPACRSARQAFRATMAGLRATYRVAVVQFHATVESARLTFWGTIKALRHS